MWIFSRIREKIKQYNVFFALAPRSGKFSETITRNMKIPFGNHWFSIDFMIFRWKIFTFRWKNTHSAEKIHIQKTKSWMLNVKLHMLNVKKPHWSVLLPRGLRPNDATIGMLIMPWEFPDHITGVPGFSGATLNRGRPVHQLKTIKLFPSISTCT